jgi:hypothetical protein
VDEARAAFLLKDDTSIRDGFIEVKFKAIAGSEDRAAGVVWRAKDAKNYYVARANALEDNFVLYKTVNGTRSPLDIVGRNGGYGVAVAVPANIWHSLRIDFKGALHRVLQRQANVRGRGFHLHRGREGGIMDQGG